ncbi:MAG TPA: single-stranded-DNA-specific exonuclease RecJ [Candidatus Binatia bacterium]|nr:single-stranded-DNA-specific exonuclease RecJ [Candidatus Binatia bacterium]
MVEPRFRWLPRDPVPLDPAFVAAVREQGASERVAAILAGRGVADPAAAASFFGDPTAGLHDPRLLPDAELVVDRFRRARDGGERVLVFGDFDADGLTGLAIVVRTCRALGVDAVPYVPSRLEEGHGLSVRAVEAARDAGASLIVTVDTGSTSHREIELARAAGIDVVVTDHHRLPDELPPALAIVNPHRPDADYPDRRLAGSGVAFKIAGLLRDALGRDAAGVVDGVDLATIGTVADLAPVLGENRAIARLGLQALAERPRPGIAALLEVAGLRDRPLDLDTIAYAIAPRLNAAGRIGEATEAARLLLTDDPAEARELATRLEAANATRRDLTREVVEAARAAVPPGDGVAVVTRGPWPVGIVGLAAARLAEETGRPAVVGAELGPLIRASCRSGPGLDLAALLDACRDLFVRYGGHPGAAGFEIEVERWPAFVERFTALVASAGPPDPRPILPVDLVLPPSRVDYGLVRELALLAPTGPGNPEPLVAVCGLEVARVRPVNGGHTQLVLRRRPDVLDAIAFGRDDLAGRLAEGDRVDVVARVASRAFGGIEALQLEIRDLASSGLLAELAKLAELAGLAGRAGLAGQAGRAGEPTVAGASGGTVGGPGSRSVREA